MKVKLVLQVSNTRLLELLRDITKLNHHKYILHFSGISPPLLPEVRGLLGVADYNSAFRLFFIPQQFRVWSESEVILIYFISK